MYFGILELGNWEIAFTSPERIPDHSGDEYEIS